MLEIGIDSNGITMKGTTTAEAVRKFGLVLGSKINNGWCECGNENDWIFVDDGQCVCGVHKHHYHCLKCGGITQIG